VNIPTVNSFIMQQNIPYAELIIYPDSITARTTSTRSSSLNTRLVFEGFGAPSKRIYRATVVGRFTLK